MSREDGFLDQEVNDPDTFVAWAGLWVAEAAGQTAQISEVPPTVGDYLSELIYVLEDIRDGKIVDARNEF